MTAINNILRFICLLILLACGFMLLGTYGCVVTPTYYKVKNPVKIYNSKGEYCWCSSRAYNCLATMKESGFEGGIDRGISGDSTHAMAWIYDENRNKQYLSIERIGFKGDQYVYIKGYRDWWFDEVLVTADLETTELIWKLRGTFKYKDSAIRNPDK